MNQEFCITTKFCHKCQTNKCKSEFNKCSRAKDGLQSSCKVCRDIAQRKARSTEVGKAKDIRYRTSEKGKESTRRNIANWRNNNPKFVIAHNSVRNAIRDGKLFPKACEVCGASSVQAHHDDYNKPLDVRWLCIKHQAEWHLLNTPIY